MKKQKQINLLGILDTGRYKVNPDTGDIYYFKKHDNTWNIKGYSDINGYRQYILYNGKRGKKNIKLSVYGHIIVYINEFGLYPEGYHIDHLDNNRANNALYNLRLVPPGVNIRKSLANINKSKQNHIRNATIKHLRAMLALGLGTTEIANRLNLSTSVVSYSKKKIEAGERFKYETDEQVPFDQSISFSTRTTAELIRSDQIKRIRELLNTGISYSEIARQVNRKRLAVLYIINKIKAGDELKYENVR